MGASQSTPQKPERPARRSEGPVYTTLDEKFDAIKITKSINDAYDSGHRVLRDSTSVSATETQRYIVELLKDRKNQLSFSALSTGNMNAILERPSTILHDTQTYNVAIPHEILPVTNQRSSGRCWIFAATNVFRIAIADKYKIKSFELSQAHLFFWDKVEKANYYLESILATVDEDVDGRLVSALNASPVGDGGQWDMIVNLVSK
jgi:bleomycin hydrolase